MILNKKDLLLIVFISVFVIPISNVKADNTRFQVDTPSSDSIVYIGDNEVSWSTIIGDEQPSTIVSIFLYKNKVLATSIEIFTQNTGSYIWTIPENYKLSGDNYQVKVEDFKDSSIYGYSGNFSISLEKAPTDFVFEFENIEPIYIIILIALLSLLSVMYDYNHKQVIQRYLEKRKKNSPEKNEDLSVERKEKKRELKHNPRLKEGGKKNGK